MEIVRLGGRTPRALICVAVLALGVAAAGCSGDTPVTPAPPAAAAGPFVPPPAPPAPPPPYPPLAEPARVFATPVALTPHHRLSDHARGSYFVLYDSGAFALVYPSFSGEYRGTYTQSDGVITFTWEGWSTAGPWGATGVLGDGTLTVRYNLVMMLTDFEDAVYTLLTPN